MHVNYDIEGELPPPPDYYTNDYLPKPYKDTMLGIGSDITDALTNGTFDTDISQMLLGGGNNKQ